MKRTLSAVAVAAAAFAAVPAYAVQPSFVDFVAPAAVETEAYRAVSAQNLPQPSFVDFTILTTAGAQAANGNVIAALPQPSSIAN